MSYEVYLSFPTSSFENLVSRIKMAPAPYTPEYFTWGERVQNKSDRVMDRERFNAFFERAKKLSFALVGNKLLYELQPNAFRDENRQPTHGYLFVEFKRGFKPRGQIIELLQFLLDVPGVQFGYACCYDESAHRHHVKKEWTDSKQHAGASSIEFTTGVDFRRYIPGLYWATIFEHSYLIGHGVSPELLSGLALESNDIELEGGKVFHCYKFYNKPDEWQENSDRLERFCAEHPQFFSMQRLSNRIEATQSEKELDDIVAPY